MYDCLLAVVVSLKEAQFNKKWSTIYEKLNEIKTSRHVNLGIK